MVRRPSGTRERDRPEVEGAALSEANHSMPGSQWEPDWLGARWGQCSSGLGVAGARYADPVRSRRASSPRARGYAAVGVRRIAVTGNAIATRAPPLGDRSTRSAQP